MMLAALVDAGASRDTIAAAIGSLPLPDVRLEFREVRRAGLRGLHLQVHFPPQKQHRHLKDVLRIIESGRMGGRAKELAVATFQELAVAEAAVHGTTVERVHFHEVGAVDSLVDICGTAVAMEDLGIDSLYASPVATGTGTVQCEHGLMPVPAPATARLLVGMPLQNCRIDGELTTPTGAAILRAAGARFEGMPAMRLAATGAGAGSRDPSGRANLLRIMVGEAAEQAEQGGILPEALLLLETWIDDMTGEQLAIARDRIALIEGVLDVVAVPVQMKRNRPGVELRILCRGEASTTVRNQLFNETTTLGVRATGVIRHSLRREQVVVETAFGLVQGKVRHLPDGTRRFKPESADCARLAVERNVDALTVARAAERAWEAIEEHRAS